MKHVVVLVLGDLGRSPRMQYHAYSFANLRQSETWKVSLVGYEGEDCTSLVSSSPHINVHRLKIFEFSHFRSIPLLHAVLKGVCLMMSVLVQLVSLPSYDIILIQNPPCLPALFAAILVSIWKKCRIVVDWHNLGFAMFQERLGPKHLLVLTAKLLEFTMVWFATDHVCVSAAMKEWLKVNFGIEATVLHDRPPRIFKERLRMSPQERHALLLKLGYVPGALFAPTSDFKANRNRIGVEFTVQTRSTKSKSCELLPVGGGSGRVGLIMSCTSWTPDEDFNLLLGAILLVEARMLELQGNGKSQEMKGFERLLVVVTGKGPLKAAFEAAVATHCAEGRLGRCVAVRTAWLAPADYPALLSCADLGVSLHTSTSGLDLPMKVLDMFGSAVPVCAFSFPALPELVQHGVNGLVFCDAQQLADQMIRLLVCPPADGGELAELRALRDQAAKISSWEDNWIANVQPLLTATRNLK